MNKLMKNIPVIFIILGVTLLFDGCTIGPKGKWSVGYNMSGAKVPAGSVTAYIQYFQTRATLVNPQLAQKLTDKLKDKILAQTNLKITNNISGGDANFEGVIMSYTNEPKQVGGGDNVTATMNQLEVKIQVKYYNNKDGEFDYDSSFTRSIEYPAEQTLEQVEGEKLDELINLLVDDIFNKAFVNW